MSEPVITIGITCFSEGDWLRECWESVQSQTDDRWTAVLVMDGGANERTREVFEQISHPRLLKHAMPTNVGCCGTHNKAFELSRTRYHFYLDADDKLPPDSVARVLNTWEKHPEAGFVYGDYELFGADSCLRRYPHSYTVEDLLPEGCLPGPCAYKVDLWSRLGGYSLELTRGPGDFDFHIGAAEAGVFGRHCGDLFYQYRREHAGRLSSRIWLEFYRYCQLMVRRHPLFFAERRRRWSFLAHAYRRSALANRNAGHWRKAALLAARSIGYGNWRDGKLWRIALRGFSPPLVVSFVARARAVVSVVRRLRRTAPES